MLAHYFNSKWDVILAALRLMHVRLENAYRTGCRNRMPSLWIC
jgi:hypothetical protein